MLQIVRRITFRSNSHVSVPNNWDVNDDHTGFIYFSALLKTKVLTLSMCVFLFRFGFFLTPIISHIARVSTSKRFPTARCLQLSQFAATVSTQLLVKAFLSAVITYLYSCHRLYLQLSSLFTASILVFS